MSYRTHDLKTPFRDYFRHHLFPYITDGFACSTEAGIWLYGEDAMHTGKIKSFKMRLIPSCIVLIQLNEIHFEQS